MLLRSNGFVPQIQQLINYSQSSLAKSTIDENDFIVENLEEQLYKAKMVDNSASNDSSIGKQEVQDFFNTASFAAEPSLSVKQNNLSTKQMMSQMKTSPRRIFLSALSSSAIALGANFCGVTSSILSSLPEDAVEQSGLDTFYPRGDFRRFKSGEFGYTFVVPKFWVADTALEAAKAQRRAKVLDYSMSQAARKKNGVIPDSAFGPPARFNDRGVSSSDENVSVVISNVRDGFTLKGVLGTPTEAAEGLLRLSIAPEGSGRLASLLAACEEKRGTSSVYQFEYNLDRGAKGVPLRAISVIAEQNKNTLITSTVVAPTTEWEDPSKDFQLRKIAESFKLTR